MNTLPTEIILSINNFLNTKDFIALSLVNSRLNKCSKIDKNEWRTRTFLDYKIILPVDTLNFKKSTFTITTTCVYYVIKKHQSFIL